LNSNDTFDPNSINATLSRILAAQDELNRKADRIITQVDLTNGRVRALEVWKAVLANQTAIVSSVVAAAIASLGVVLNYFSSK
jgi:hypothetical protein